MVTVLIFFSIFLVRLGLHARKRHTRGIAAHLILNIKGPTERLR